jgi:hypothetical protein
MKRSKSNRARNVSNKSAQVLTPIYCVTGIPRQIRFMPVDYSRARTRGGDKKGQRITWGIERCEQVGEGENSDNPCLLVIGTLASDIFPS